MEDVVKRLDRLEEKMDRILELLEGDLKNNCEKMGEHIEFVERVYDNVKRHYRYWIDRIQAKEIINCDKKIIEKIDRCINEECTTNHDKNNLTYKDYFYHD